MKKFEGARWAPAMRRNGGGQTTPAAPPAAPQGYDIYGYGGDHNTAASNPVVAPASHPKLDLNKPIVDAAANMGKKGGMRKAMTPQLLSSIAMGGLAGLGGGKGIAAAMVMQGANILKNYLDQKKKVGATPSVVKPGSIASVMNTISGGDGGKTGGRVKMKGHATNAQSTNKQPAKPATKKAAHGGAMKKKKY